MQQWDRLLGMAKEGLYEYGGRDTVPDALFYSGQAAIGFGSSAGRGDIVRNAKFKWAAAFLPIDPAVNTHPINSIIGGASLWTMTTKQRTAAEYKAVAEFLRFLCDTGARRALPSNHRIRAGHVRRLREVEG